MTTISRLASAVRPFTRPDAPMAFLESAAKRAIRHYEKVQGVPIYEQVLAKGASGFPARRNDSSFYFGAGLFEDDVLLHLVDFWRGSYWTDGELQGGRLDRDSGIWLRPERFCGDDSLKSLLVSRRRIQIGGDWFWEASLSRRVPGDLLVSYRRIPLDGEIDDAIYEANEQALILCVLWKLGEIGGSMYYGDRRMTPEFYSRQFHRLLPIDRPSLDTAGTVLGRGRTREEYLQSRLDGDVGRDSGSSEVEIIYGRSDDESGSSEGDLVRRGSVKSGSVISIGSDDRDSYIFLWIPVGSVSGFEWLNADYEDDNVLLGLIERDTVNNCGVIYRVWSAFSRYDAELRVEVR